MHSLNRDSSKPAKGTPLTSADVRRIFYGLMLAMFLSALNQTIVATALPTIGRDFGDFREPFLGHYRLSSGVDRRVAALWQAFRHPWAPRHDAGGDRLVSGGV